MPVSLFLALNLEALFLTCRSTEAWTDLPTSSQRHEKWSLECCSCRKRSPVPSSSVRTGKKKKEVAEIGTLIEIWVKNFRRTDPNGQSAYKRCPTSLVIRNANQKCQELRHTMSHLLWSKTAWEVAWGCSEVSTAFAWHTKTNKETNSLSDSQQYTKGGMKARTHRYSEGRGSKIRKFKILPGSNASLKLVEAVWNTVSRVPAPPTKTNKQ